MYDPQECLHFCLWPFSFAKPARTFLLLPWYLVEQYTYVNKHQRGIIMFRSSITRLVLGVLAIIAVLGVLRFKPWQRFTVNRTAGTNSTVAREQLTIGFLPVT